RSAIQRGGSVAQIAPDVVVAQLVFDAAGHVTLDIRRCAVELRCVPIVRRIPEIVGLRSEWGEKLLRNVDRAVDEEEALGQLRIAGEIDLGIDRIVFTPGAYVQQDWCRNQSIQVRMCAGLHDAKTWRDLRNQVALPSAG